MKKAYYQMLKHDQRQEEDASNPDTAQELGRFASETADSDGDATEAPRRRPASEEPKPKKLPYFYRPSRNKAPKDAAPPPRTREQALEDRAARQAKWHRPSPSRLGRQRGQPDLGARMEVMLEKIQRQRA